jgi:hypothetical protein
MKKLNALMGALLLGVSIGSVSAADIMQGNDAAAVSSATVATVTPAAKPSITLSQVNQLRKEGRSVTVLFAVPPMSTGAHLSFLDRLASARREKALISINGSAYNLWNIYESSDLERAEGILDFSRVRILNDRAEEIWHRQHYLVKQGILPGESENALEMTGQIPGVNGTVYVFLGENFYEGIDPSHLTSDGRLCQQIALQYARDRALAARKSSVK